MLAQAQVLRHQRSFPREEGRERPHRPSNHQSLPVSVTVPGVFHPSPSQRNTSDLNIAPSPPGAYKDIDAVMAAQDDLVEVVHTLKQVVCVKG